MIFHRIQSGSCDSLFSKHDTRFTASNSGDSFSDAGGFGNSLDDDSASAKFSNGSVRQTQPQVPPLITACIDHLTNYGLHVVGIFRVSTSKRRIREVRRGGKFRTTIHTFGRAKIFKCINGLFFCYRCDSYAKNLTVVH